MRAKKCQRRQHGEPWHIFSSGHEPRNLFLFLHLNRSFLQDGSQRIRFIFRLYHDRYNRNVRHSRSRGFSVHLKSKRRRWLLMIKLRRPAAKREKRKHRAQTSVTALVLSRSAILLYISSGWSREGAGRMFCVA